LKHCSSSFSFSFLNSGEAQEDAVASTAGDFQQMNLHEEESMMHNNAQEENPAVIIPDHLQVSNADCAHLSFGSFSSGAFSGMFQQKTLEPLPEDAPTVEEPSTVEQPDNRYKVLAEIVHAFCVFQIDFMKLDSN
jgi:hypothetical protein